MPGSEPQWRVLPPARVVPDADARECPDETGILDEVWAALDLPVAVLDVDREGVLRWAAVNPAQERALGVPFESLRGRVVEAGSPVALAQWLHERAHALAILRDRVNFEPERPDGDTGRWVARKVAPLFDEEGALRRLVVTSHDVTEQQRLAALVAQATRMDAVGRAAGETAHEFNNLMVAISGYAGLVLRSMPSDGRAHDHMLEVLRLTDAASTLTRQMLAFTKRQEGTPSLVRLDTLAAGMEHVLRRFLREGITLELRRAMELWVVRVDQQQIEQVLIHLASRARESMPRGGSFVLDAANVTLSREEARSLGLGAGEHVVLSVRDTGAGLDAHSMQRMFEAPAGSVLTRSDVEVGLATCYGIVRKHGGAITVASAPGQGAVFRIHLPRAREKSSVSGVTMASASLQGNETVLVADPLPTREAVTRTLRMLGYTVLDAPSAKEALRLVEDRERAPIHLVVLGVGPAEPGAEALLRALRARDGDIPVLVTAPDEASIMPIGLMSARVVKLPASLAPTSLAKRVREALDERARPLK